jgi:hypothetical protein
MVDRIAKLEAALRVNAALLVHAQRLIAAYIAPESDRAAIISGLIRLLDGPAQREAKRLSEVALSEAKGVEEKDPALTLQIRNLTSVLGAGRCGRYDRIFVCRYPVSARLDRSNFRAM